MRSRFAPAKGEGEQRRAKERELERVYTSSKEASMAAMGTNPNIG